jgi:hypothetical protein
MPFCQSQMMYHSTKWLAFHIPSGSINYCSRKTSHKIHCHTFVHFTVTVPKYLRHKGKVVCRYDNTETYWNGETDPCSIKCSITFVWVVTLKLLPLPAHSTEGWAGLRTGVTTAAKRRISARLQTSVITALTRLSQLHTIIWYRMTIIVTNRICI